MRQETRHWDEADGRTHTLRTKEDADDYRYFPEPDLVPLAPDGAWIEAVRAALPAAAGRAPDAASPTAAGRRRRRRRRRASPSSAGWTTSPLARHRRRRRPGRVLVHVEHNLAGDGAGAVRPAGWPR